VEISLVIENIKRGDKKAFDVLVEQYYGELYHTALGVLHSGWDAHDICQETFLKVYASINTLKDTNKIRPWMYKILVNKCNDYFRKNKKISNWNYDQYNGFIEYEREDLIDLFKALSLLKEDTRIVIALRYFQDMSLKEIANIIGCPEGTVKSRLSYGLKDLKHSMKKCWNWG
jgi:RNA polymerase sigma-70 factor, ECF subfamily